MSGPGTALRVLLVEDSENDALLLLDELERGGYEPENQGVGVGQQSMLQRAREIGGVLEVESASGGGTRVRFEAPVSRLKGR